MKPGLFFCIISDATGLPTMLLRPSTTQLAPFVGILYLANNSNDTGWKNVIKEYNVTGDNVAHYNLPASQQSAIENFLGVHSFPSYRLFDQQGNLLDVNADPRDLNALEGLIKKLVEQ